MKLPAGLLCILLLCTPLAHGANALKQAADAIYGQTVFLRGMELGKQLNFDAQGSPLGTYTTGPFAYSAVHVKKVHVSSDALELKCERLAMLYDGTSQTPSVSDIRDIRYVPLKETVNITIAGDATNPSTLRAAIQKVLAFSPDEALTGQSAAAQQAALFSLGSTVPVEPPPASQHSTSKTTSATDSIPPGTTPPRLVYSVTPK